MKTAKAQEKALALFCVYEYNEMGRFTFAKG